LEGRYGLFKGEGILIMQYILDFILLGTIYFLFFFEKWKKKKRERFILYSLVYLYISLVIFVTLMPFSFPIPGSNSLFLETVNLTPFIDLKLHHGGAVREIILNIIMMAPFGFLMPFIKRRNFFSIACWTFIFSLSIETMQLLYVWSGGINNRAFDVTDLITNTLGGILGYIVYLVIRPIIKRLNK